MSNDFYYYPKRLNRIVSYKRPFNFSIGGRGCGKTYGHLLDKIERDRTFVYMRRTSTELNTLMGKLTSESMNPFKSINRDYGYDFKIKKVDKYLGLIVSGDREHGSEKHLGYAMALTTVSNIRGFDASDALDIVYDEFIPEKHKNKIRGEADAFFNAYETINRNRELQGNEPLYVYAISNANTIASALFYETGLMPKVESMVRNGQNFSDMPDRSCTMEIIPSGEFGEMKAKTALYQFTKGTNFADMALNNEFAYDDFSNVQSINLRDFVGICSYGDIGIFTHKSDGRIYAGNTIPKDKERFPMTEVGTKQFLVRYQRKIYGAILNDRIYYENYQIKFILTDLIV